MYTQEKKKKAHKGTKGRHQDLITEFVQFGLRLWAQLKQWGGLYIKWHERRELQSSTTYKRLIPTLTSGCEMETSDGEVGSIKVSVALKGAENI